MENKKQILTTVRDKRGKIKTNHKFSDWTEKLDTNIYKFKRGLRHRTIRPTINRAIILSILLIFISSWPVLGATYYVKAGGDDSLDGLTDSTAWATIAKATSASVQSGDTVYFNKGDTWVSLASSVAMFEASTGVTYDGKTYGNGEKPRATFKASDGFVENGTHSGLVRISKSNVTFRGFEVDGNSQNTGGIYVGLHAPSAIANVTVDDCYVHHVGNPSLSGKWLYGIYAACKNALPTTNTNLTIKNSEVAYSYHEGIAIYSSWNYSYNKADTVLVQNCSSHDNGTRGDLGGHGIIVVNDADNVTVEFCNSYNNRGLGMWVRTSPLSEGGSNIFGGPTNLHIRYNLFHDNVRGGLQFTNPRGETITASVYSNLIFNNGKNTDGNVDASDLAINSCAQTVNYSSNSYAESEINIYNNTFFNTTNECKNLPSVVGISIDSTIITGTPIFRFMNNIVYSGVPGYVPINDGGGQLTHSNNLIYRTSSELDTHVKSNGTAYNRSGVKTWEQSAKNTIPAFTGGTLPTGFTGTYGNCMAPNTFYFAIISGDALDGGMTLGNPYNGCINGAGLAMPIARPKGSAYDIGAYEYVGSLSYNTYPTAPKMLRVQ